MDNSDNSKENCKKSNSSSGDQTSSDRPSSGESNDNDKSEVTNDETLKSDAQNHPQSFSHTSSHRTRSARRGRPLSQKGIVPLTAAFGPSTSTQNLPQIPRPQRRSTLPPPDTTNHISHHRSSSLVNLSAAVAKSTHPRNISFNNLRHHPRGHNRQNHANIMRLSQQIASHTRVNQPEVSSDKPSNTEIATTSPKSTLDPKIDNRIKFIAGTDEDNSASEREEGFFENKAAYKSKRNNDSKDGDLTNIQVSCTYANKSTTEAPSSQVEENSAVDKSNEKELLTSFKTSFPYSVHAPISRTQQKILLQRASSILDNDQNKDFSEINGERSIYFVPNMQQIVDRLDKDLSAINTVQNVVTEKLVQLCKNI